MKRVLSVLLALCLLIGAVPVFASAADSDFVIEDGVLIEYNGPGGDVVLPDGLTCIGGGSFQWCENLTSLKIPDSVVNIEAGAFMWCTNLTSINIPDGVDNIAWDTFDGCKSLTSINIPDSVISIGERAFGRCESLTSIVIPDSVTSIGSFAFYDCESLISINIPYGVDNIEYGTFSGCKSLTGIKIPDGVTSIGDKSFSGCESLTSIVIPDGVTSIGEHAFLSCSSLASINIPEGVANIADMAFAWCESLTSITIPDSVTSISNAAFRGAGLTSVEIPSGVTAISKYAFAGCSNLKNINVDGNNSIYSSVDGVLYTKAGDKLLFYPAGRNGHFTIPDGVVCVGENAFYQLGPTNCPTGVTFADSVTNIEPFAFSDCNGLTQIVLPKGLTNIGQGAFQVCENLANVTIPSSVVSIGEGAFNYCEKLKDVYYDGTKEQWGKINIDKDNEYLTRATIHFGETPKPPKPSEPTVGDFTDVKASAYYADAVLWAVENGITAGTGGNKFSPNKTCTRDQIVTFLYRSKNSPEVTVTDQFTDMPKSEEFQKAISWAVEKDITVGDGKGHFLPGKGCTRVQAVTFIWRAANRPEPESIATFTDMPANSDFQKAISWASENGITSGIGNNKFGPDQTCTRGQIVTFLYNAKDL